MRIITGGSMSVAQDPTGDYIGLFIITAIAMFIVFELWAMVTDKTTWSQRVVMRAKRSNAYALGMLGFALFIMGTGIWLVFHWELLCILFSSLCW